MDEKRVKELIEEKINLVDNEEFRHFLKLHFRHSELNWDQVKKQLLNCFQELSHRRYCVNEPNLADAVSGYVDSYDE